MSWTDKRENLLRQIDIAIDRVKLSDEQVKDAERVRAYEDGSNNFLLELPGSRLEHIQVLQRFCVVPEGAPETVTFKVDKCTYTIQNHVYALARFRRQVKRQLGKNLGPQKVAKTLHRSR